jgi:hypothetical protein
MCPDAELLTKHLVAETRYFNELNGRYRLEYGYDLARELTSRTDPWY